jgi:anti-sigma factor RsiW
MTCGELVDVVTDYLEGAVDARRRADVERHIVICRGCASYVAQMRATIDLLGRLADRPIA